MLGGASPRNGGEAPDGGCGSAPFLSKRTHRTNVPVRDKRGANEFRAQAKPLASKNLEYETVEDE